MVVARIGRFTVDVGETVAVDAPPRVGRPPGAGPDRGDAGRQVRECRAPAQRQRRAPDPPWAVGDTTERDLPPAREGRQALADQAARREVLAPDGAPVLPYVTEVRGCPRKVEPGRRGVAPAFLRRVPVPAEDARVGEVVIQALRARRPAVGDAEPVPVGQRRPVVGGLEGVRGPTLRDPPRVRRRHPGLLDAAVPVNVVAVTVAAGPRPPTGRGLHDGSLHGSPPRLSIPAPGKSVSRLALRTMDCSCFLPSSSDHGLS